MLGQGSFGVVFRVKDRKTGEIYAAKNIHVYNDEEFFRAKAEVEILRQI